MSETPTPQSPFLGGGPRFNQAGNNTPMPGEKKADTPPPPPFGGPKVWMGVIAVIVLLAVLYFVYGNAGFLSQNASRHPVDINGKPDVSPDSTPSSSQ